VLYPVEVFVRLNRSSFGSFLFAVLCAVAPHSAFATGSVTLAWNAPAGPAVAGYNVYYGSACGVYTNKICAGGATNATITGLIPGTTYFFAATSFAASGVESPLSCEVSYRVPLNAPVLICTNAYAAVICTNDYRFSTNILADGKFIITPLPPAYTNYVFTGLWIYPPASGWTLQSSSNLVTWVNYATGSNAVFIPKTGGNRFFRLKSP
jgi:hypothetical protein